MFIILVYILHCSHNNYSLLSSISFLMSFIFSNNHHGKSTVLYIIVKTMDPLIIILIIFFSMVYEFSARKMYTGIAMLNIVTTIVICIATVSTARHLVHSLPLDTLRRSKVLMINTKA